MEYSLGLLIVSLFPISQCLKRGTVSRLSDMFPTNGSVVNTIENLSFPQWGKRRQNGLSLGYMVGTKTVLEISYSTRIWSKLWLLMNIPGFFSFCMKNIEHIKCR